MKKLSVLLVAIFFSLLSVGNALAAQPEMSNLDRNAVWTNWAWNSSHRQTDEGMMRSGKGLAQNVSTKDFKPQYKPGEVAEFDFVRETKYYDYKFDRDKSS